MLRRLVVPSVLIVGLALAGCSSDKGDKDDSSPPPSRSTSPTKSSSGLVQPSNVPTKVGNTPALRNSVALTGCAKSGKGWAASGTAKNTRKSKFDYTITIFFTTPSATVIGFGKTSVSVKAGKSAKWRVSGTFPAVKDTKCVLRGVAKG